MSGGERRWYGRSVTRPRGSRQRQPSAFFGGSLPRILAHRGFAAGVDENTLEAFAAALAAGAQIIETDVQATRDGIAVLFHDEVLPSGIRVADITAEELQLVVLPLGGRVSTLREALTAFPAAKFNIDLKSAEAIDDAASAIHDAGAITRVLVTSFSGQRRRAAVRRLSGVATSASATIVVTALIAGKFGWSALMTWILRDVDAVQIPETVLGLTTTTPGMVYRWHSAGVEVHVWTINEELGMHRLIAAGVDGIVTDHCDVAHRVFAL